MNKDYSDIKGHAPELLKTDRWERGVEHHPLSERVVRFLSAHDQHDYNMYFDWRCGGDGDNGENLMFQMDPFFEWLDKQTQLNTPFERDGDVAIVYRPSYGMGWSSYVGTSVKNPQWFATNGVLARLVEAQDWNAVRALVESKYPGQYLGTLENLKITWLPKGTVFEILEHDGCERIEVTYRDFLVA